MKYYTDTISIDLAKKLKEKGAPEVEWVYYNYGGIKMTPNYAEVFDWLMSEKRQYVWIEPHFRVSDERFSFRINSSSDERIFDTWYEAATKAIERALELI